MVDRKRKSLLAAFLNGLLPQNPVFRLALGMCPTLGVTTVATAGLGMGLSTTVVIICTNLFISLMRNIIPEKVRLPAFVVIIASFGTVVELIIKAFFPDLNDALGVFIPLIVVNCIVFARAEAYAFKNPPLYAIMDGLGMGLGFTAALTILAMVRELMAFGTVFGVHILTESFPGIGIMSMVPGGFIALGLLIAMVNAGTKHYQAHREAMKEDAV